jgi:hypothetical protein
MRATSIGGFLFALKLLFEPGKAAGLNAAYHAGAMEGWAQFRLGPPDVPVPARGNLFLRW